MSQSEHSSNIRKILVRRLQELEKQEAIFGYRADPAICTEIEDIKNKLKNIPESTSISYIPLIGDFMQKLVLILIIIAIIGFFIYRSRNTENNINSVGNNANIIQGDGNINIQNPQYNQPSIDNAIRIEASQGCNSMGMYYFHESDFNISNINTFHDVLAHLANDSIGTPICSHPIIGLDVISKASDEWIRMPQYLVVKIVKTNQLQEKFHSIQVPAGSAGYPDFFQAILSPDMNDIFGAPLIPSEPQTRIVSEIQQFGYFNLIPGERETFQLDILAYPGYHYKFQVGIFYTYKGEKFIKWADSTFEAYGITNVMDIWDATNDPEFIHKGDRETDIEGYNHLFAEEKKKIEKITRQDPAFTLP